MQDAKNTPKARYLGTIAQSSDCRFATKACIDNRKKLVKQQYLLHMSSKYGELWPTNGTLAISTVFASWLRYCSDVTQRRPTKLCTMFGHLLGCYTKYTFCRLLPPNGILPGAKCTLRPSLAFSDIGSVIVQHSSSGRQPNCGVEQTAPPIFSSSGDHHIGHRPTF